MQRLLPALALTAALAMPATAGGPVLVEDDFVTEARPSSEGRWIIPVIIGLTVICAIACGGDKDEPSAPPPPACKGDC